MKLVDVVDPPVLLPDPLRRDPPQPELHFEDMAGQAHPADRGAKEVRVLLGRAVEHPAIGDPHLEGGDVVAEVAVFVLVLSVDIRGDHPAQGDELRARGHRREVPAWHQQTVEVAESEPGFGAEPARALVQAQNAIG